MQRAQLLSVASYYDLPVPLSARFDIWRTVYNHSLADAAVVVECVKKTGLKPFTDPLDVAEREAYLAAYTARIAAAYPPSENGKVLLRFPKLFIVAQRG